MSGEFPLGNLREYFFNEILSKMTPRIDQNSPFNEHLKYGGNMWEYIL